MRISRSSWRWIGWSSPRLLGVVLLPSPGRCGDSGDTLGILDIPETLGIPGIPETLGIPGIPETLGIPGIPETLGIPGIPETLDTRFLGSRAKTV
jgi:hypothetical protein